MRKFSAFIVLVILIACKKNSVNNESSANGVNSTDSFYFKAKMNGKYLSWIVPSHKNESSFSYVTNAQWGYSDLSKDCGEGNCYYMDASTEIRANLAEPKERVAIGFNMATQRMGREEISSWFVAGSKSYAYPVRPVSALTNSVYNGVYIYYVDANGKDWATQRGFQQKSSFQSLLFADEVRTDVTPQKVWKAKFSCRLYDIAGNFIDVEDGEVYGPVLLPRN